ncbi:hemin receptor precursor [mine drainage metagenome]|uniref:Hemin receptor n=1 Tax=mine drainage metagenome TaxID=410659 RepID=A0A1J5S919_9ZZZZ
MSSHIFKRKLLSVAVLSACGMTQNAIAADASSEKLMTAPIVVTATRVEQNSFDVPASIDVVDSAQIHDQQLQTNLSESLARIPGITVANRQNYAQDLQISSRGFGARAPFGVKGIRIIVDDIPATMPDGQGQGATIPLGSTDHIEILRGPFSALYGNGAGGVLQAFTEDGKGSPTLSTNFAVGSYGTTREELKASGKEGTVSYLVDSSWFGTDGYRNHSKTDRNQANAKIVWEINDSTKIKLSANSYYQAAEDPLGLTLEQLAYNPTMAGGGTNPSGTTPSSITFNSRKTINYNQAGLVLDKDINENNSFKVITYYGTRKVLQIQSFNPLGVVDLDRDFGGINLRYNYSTDIEGQKLKITGGLDFDKSNENRKAFDNNNGTPSTAALRNEDDSVYNLDPYVQANLQLGSDWEVTGGLRHNNVNFKLQDNLNPLGANSNSGSVSYSKTTPSIGVVFHATPTINLYANAGKGFETPTFAEISYSLNSNGTVNTTKSTLSLKPAESTTYEIGTKAFIADNSRLNVAFFTTKVTNEIAAANNSGGKVAYQNIPETERNGLEVSLDTNWTNSLKTYLAYTYLDATVSQTYSKKVSGSPQTINSGNQIPGISKNSLYGEIQWSYDPIGFSTAVEANWRSKYYATDINDASSLAKSFVAANIRAGFNQKINNWGLSEFVRVNNIFDRNYVGSVIVNDSNSRFFEPAPGRNWLLGASASYQF